MLSYVEFYKPKFFLLENVLGFLSHKLQINKLGPQDGEMVANGVIKFILRTLTSLGYVIAFDSLPSPQTPTDALGQLSSPFQCPASRSVWIAAESSPHHHLGRTARHSPSRVSDPDSLFRDDPMGRAARHRSQTRAHHPQPRTAPSRRASPRRYRRRRDFRPSKFCRQFVRTILTRDRPGLDSQNLTGTYLSPDLFIHIYHFARQPVGKTRTGLSRRHQVTDRT
jgi:hypothetical protein